MKVICAGLAMVTSSSWMANARTSFFTVRAPVGIWNGSTLRSVGSNNMLPSVLFLKAGVACCLPTCAQGSSVPNTGNLGIGLFWALGFLVCVLCTWRVLVLLASLLCTRLGLLRCASCWTRPWGGGRWRYYLCNFLEEHPKVHKTPYRCICRFSGCYKWELYMLALVGQPSLHGYDACMVYSVKGHSGEIAGKQNIKPLFLLPGFFCLVEILLKDSGHDILVHPPMSSMLVLNFIMLVAGSLMETFLCHCSV